MKSGFLRRLLVPFMGFAALFNWSSKSFTYSNDGKKIDAINDKRRYNKGRNYGHYNAYNKRYDNNKIYKRRKQNKQAKAARRLNRERR